MAGRPEIPIDWKKVDKLLMCGCPATEIAAHFGMHADTITNRVKEKYGMLFTDYSAELRQKGKSLLREAQFDKAMTLDNTMLIWLGKNWLEQKENLDKSELSPNDTALKTLIAELKLQRNPDAPKPEAADQL